MDTLRRRWIFVALCAASACESVVGGGEAEGTSSDGSGGSTASGITGTASSNSASSSASSSASTGTTTSADTTGPSTTLTTADDESDDDGPVCFFHHHEVGIPGDCLNDGWCCPGEKCVPSFGYGECVPLERMPAGIGEACIRRGVNDDCIAGAVCRGSDPETGEGRCIEICEFGHECDDMATACVDYPQWLCLPPCDPVGGPACSGSDACLPMVNAEIFACVPDELPTQPGMAGDPCVPDPSSYAGCDTDHLCVPDAAVAIESCAGDKDDGCCTRLCAIADPLGCMGIGDEICEPMHTLLVDFWADEAYGVGFCR